MYSMYGENFKFRAYTTEILAVYREQYEMLQKKCKNNGNTLTHLQKTAQIFSQTE